MADWVKKRDDEFAAQMATLSGALTAAPADYSVEAGDVTPISTALTAFNTKRAASDAAAAAAKTAVTEKVNARAALETLVRPMARRVQETASVTDEARVAAGLPVRDKVRTAQTPITPAALTATLDGPTAVILSWSTNGNAAGASYVVERRNGATGDYSLADVVTASRVRIAGLTPGQRVEFRVRARRSGQTSEPSNVAAIYAD